MILEEAIVTVIETYWFLRALVVSHCCCFFSSLLFSRFVFIYLNLNKVREGTYS